MHKRLSTLLLAATLSCAAAAHEPPPPVPPPAAGDSQGFSRNGYVEHFAVSALIGVGVSSHIEKGSFLKAWTYSMIPGTLKELSDSQQRGNHFSGRDMLANALGAAIGVGVGRIFLTKVGDTTTVAVQIKID